MKPLQVDKHLDTACPGAQQPPQATSRAHNSGFSGFHSSPKEPKAPERLAHLAYAILKDKDLRKKMSELGLPTGGTRQMLEKRHQEWVTIWNANCDSAKPKRRSELLNDLDVWERTVGSRAPSMSKAAVIGQQIKDKDFDGAAWASKHEDSFNHLIANAKRTKMQAQQKQKEASESEPQPSPAREEVKQVQPQQEALPQPPPSIPAADLTNPSPHSASIPHPQLAYMEQHLRIPDPQLEAYLNAIVYPNGTHFPDNRINLPPSDIPPQGPNWDAQYRGGPPS